MNTSIALKESRGHLEFPVFVESLNLFSADRKPTKLCRKFRFFEFENIEQGAGLRFGSLPFKLSHVAPMRAVCLIAVYLDLDSRLA